MGGRTRILPTCHLLQPYPLRAQDHLLKEVTDIDVDSPIWNDLYLIKALSQYITSSRTGFFPEINLDFSPPIPPKLPLPFPGDVIPFLEEFNVFGADPFISLHLQKAQNFVYVFVTNGD